MKEYSKGFRFKETELGVFAGSSDTAVDKLEKNKRIIGLTRGDLFMRLSRTLPADLNKSLG